MKLKCTTISQDDLKHAPNLYPYKYTFDEILNRFFFLLRADTKVKK